MNDSGTRPSISDVLAKHTNEWMKLPGVTGTGETRLDTQPAILILVDTLTSSLRATLPTSVEGYPVVIQAVGTVRALH